MIGVPERKVLFKSNRTEVFAPQSEQVSKVYCYLSNDCNGETKQVFAPQSEQVSKVQAFHIMNESNGETKKLIAPQREQASRVQKCHIINDCNGETKNQRQLMLSNCRIIDELNSINYSTENLEFYLGFVNTIKKEQQQE